MGRHHQFHVNAEKQEYENKLNSFLDKYSRVLFVGMDNVRSQQIHDVRHDLRGKAVLVMGKKTLQRKIIKNRADRDDSTEDDKTFEEKTEQLNLLRYNTGLVFTNEDPKIIMEVLEKHRVQAPARVGAVAPCEVVIPAGNTGMEPTQTSFFQALNIATKITKGTVEIITEKKVLSTGERVDNSTAALLQKLKISPFYYKMEVKSMWDRGVVFELSDLTITDETIENMLIDGIKNLSAISLGAGIPTAVSFPIMVADSFKNLLAAAVATGYDFSEFGAEEIIKNTREGKLAAVAAPVAIEAAAASAGAKEETKEAEPEEEEDDDFGMGGLF